MLCGNRGCSDVALCPRCRRELPVVEGACIRCGVPLPSDGLCGQCLERPPPFQRTIVALRYVSPARELVHGLKFRRNMAVADILGRLLAQRLSAEPGESPELVIPVPLHRKRLRERGFNQALEIGRVIARQMDIAIGVDRCRRVRHTMPQAQMDSAERRRNLRGAFKVDAHGVRGRHVAVLDDVMTTGTTVAELASTLTRAGARRVDVWACCRSVPTYRGSPQKERWSQ